MKKLLIRAAKAVIPASMLPFVTSAATEVNTLLLKVRDTLNIVITILFILMTIYFIWGVIQYVLAAGDEEKLKSGKKHMIYGLIGMAVAGAVWGIVQIIWGYLGVSSGVNGVIIPSFQ